MFTKDFDSGSGTFLQRGSPPPPPWRLLPESFFFIKLPTNRKPNRYLRDIGRLFYA